MRPYRLALLLVCLSIGRGAVGQEVEEVAAAAEKDVAADAIEAGSLPSLDEDAAVALNGSSLTPAEEQPVEYEWKPFLKEFPNATCPNLQGVERFRVLVDYQCPGKRSWYSCVDDLLDVPDLRRYKCRPILFRWEKHVVNRTARASTPPSNEIAIRPEEVHMAAPNFIVALKERGRHGSNFCMLMMFFSPSCPFSARWAPYFNALPPRYTNILFVAVNASDSANSRMNSRLGISGTPTMVLYVDGAPVARVDEQADPAVHLPKFIESMTDWHTDGPLEPYPEGNVQVTPSEDRSDWWLPLSVVVYAVATLYHIAAYTATGKRKWAEVLQRLRI